MKRSLSVLLFSFLLVSAPSTPAQQQTGLPHFGSLESGGFDALNHQNLNVSFAIPVMSKPGRGIPFSHAITYNSLVWSPTSSGSTFSWTPSSNYGWNWAPSIGGLSYVFSWDMDCGVGKRENFYTNFVYTDPSGTPHPFNLFLITTGCPAGSRTGYATDASGYYIDATNFSQASRVATIYAPGGTKFVSGTTPATLTDANGNLLSLSNPVGGETDVTDTTGQVISKEIDTSGQSSLQYQDTSGIWQSVIVKTQTYQIKTNFACSNVSEFTGSTTLPYEIDLPNGPKFTITYEPTPGHSGYYTGRLLTISLPTGGSYEYDYTGANGGINCSDGSVLNLTRKVGDGTTTNTRTYARTQPDSSTWKTTVTPPTLPYDSAANVATYIFNTLGQETSRNFYQGAESPSNLLRTISTMWATNKTPASQTTILENNQQSQVQTDYDSNGRLLETREYDLGSGTPGSLVRRTTLTYATIGQTHIINHVASTIVKDGSGNIKSRTVYGYDEGGVFSGPNCIPGAAGHDDTNFPCSFTTRGNRTSVTTYTDPVTPGGAITKNFTYDSFGNLRTAQLNCCQLKTLAYSATTNYAFPDSVTSGSSAPQLTTSATYNSFTGLTATTTDENNQQTSYAYDIEKRLTSVTRPDSTQIVYAYNDVARTVTSTAPVTTSTSVKQIASLDGLGRPVKSQTTDGSGTSYSISETQYDPLGRAYKTSNPHNSTAQYWTETRFDGMGRQIKTILQDQSQTTISYSGPAATLTDPAGKQRKVQHDGLGRLTSLWEPDPTSGNSLTLQTTYAYNVFDALTSSTQGVQTRTYSYDALGRLASSYTPEAGTLCFGTISGGNCQADGYDSFGNLLYRTDARGVQANYIYDSLNRTLGVSYSNVPAGVSPMPNVCATTGSSSNNANVCFTYGTSAGNFNNGRLISMADPSGSESYSYNNLGEITQLQKTIGSTAYLTTYQYNLAGETTGITYPSGRTVQQTVDAIGRLCSVGASGSTCTTGSNYASNFSYNPAQQVTGFSYGNGVQASFGFSSDRLQLNCLDYSTTNRNGNCAHDGTTKFGLGYSYGPAGGNNGQISSITDSVDSGRSATYTYDSLYRLTNAATTGSTNYPAWGLSETYDRYGNRSAQGISSGCAGITCPTNSVTITPATNHISGSPYSYDANGNMTNDGQNTLVYDGENHLTSGSGSLGSGTYTYDARGLRVKKVSGSTTTVYIFSGSKVIAEYDNGATPSAPSREYIYAGGALLAKIDASGTRYYQRDHLSNRLITDSSGNILAQLGHSPFGESWYNASNEKWLFTTYERDAESGNDYAMARSYASRLGRFLSPDPAAGRISDPQSLNRYSYAHNDPINFVDPSGMFVAPQIYALMRFYNVPMFGSLWNEFDLLRKQVTGELYHSDDPDFPFEKYTSDQLQSLAGDHVIQDLGQVSISIGVLLTGSTGSGANGPGDAAHGAASKKCSGYARIVGPGKPGNGKYGPTVYGSLAVIPGQFFGSNSTSLADYQQYGAALRPYVDQISVSVASPQGPRSSDMTLGPVTDVIDRTGAASLVATYGQDTLILETNGFILPEQQQFVTLTIPGGLKCPIGTGEVK